MAVDVVDLSFGEYLKHMRNQHGLQAAEVARELKISTALINAMEDEDQAKFPERIYMKGYLRLLAKRYEVEESHLFDLYEALAGDKTILPDTVRQVSEEVTSEDWPIRGATWLVILLIGVMVVLWWWQGLHPTDQAYHPVLKNEMFEQHIMPPSHASLSPDQS